MVNVETFEVMIGEVMVWECSNSCTQIWEAVSETGLIIGAYSIDEDAVGWERYPWFHAGWKKVI